MDLNKGIEYTPKYDGNRDKPEGERVRVWCQRLRYQFTSRNQKLAAEVDPEKQMELQKDILRAHVRKIENLCYGDEKLEDGADLVDCEAAPVALITELVGVIIGGVDAELEKN